MTPRFSILAPAARLYGFLMARRRRRFLEKPATQLENCAVISVGNITVGGTGKTPAVQYIARLLQEDGARVAVVARGYGGTLEKRGAVVSDGQHIFHEAREVGDEPLLHARALPGVPVVIGMNRVRAAQIALKKFAPEVILLDDAFQFYSLHRDLNLVLLDARRPLGNGHLLPRGTLREEAAALRRADVLLLTRADRATPQQLLASREKLRAFSEAPILEASHAPAKLFRVNFEQTAREYSQSQNAVAQNAVAQNARREQLHRTSEAEKSADNAASSRGDALQNALTTSASAKNTSREYSQRKNESAEIARGAFTHSQNAAMQNAQHEQLRVTDESAENARDGAVSPRGDALQNVFAENVSAATTSSENTAREYSQPESDEARAEDAGARRGNAIGAARRDENEKFARREKARTAIASEATGEKTFSENEMCASESGEYSLEWLRGKTVSAASALADNAAFRATLENLGARVAWHCARRDHHKWRDAEILAAARKGKERGAQALLVTEKDAVKISCSATQKSALPVFALGIELRVMRGETELRALILSAASTRNV